MTSTKLSIRQISILTALDRDTVTRRLQGLQSEIRRETLHARRSQLSPTDLRKTARESRQSRERSSSNYIF